MPCAASGERALVEAKASATRGHVRTAIGQLFDYTVGMPAAERPTHLELLVPDRPAQGLLDLCARVGIDVVHPDGDAFTRLEAPGSARAGILAQLHGPGQQGPSHTMVASRPLRFAISVQDGICTAGRVPIFGP